MNLNVLSIHVMLWNSGHWLKNDALRAQLAAHPVSAAMLGEVARVHARLAGQAERRRQAGLELAQLTALLAELDLIHDNMARALHGALDALIVGTTDPALRASYQRLQRLLFPEGLSIVSRSYSYEAGAITALEARMTEADVAELAAIQIGPQTLADWYRAWVAAGHELGRIVHARAARLAGNKRGGSASASVDQRSARLDWVNTVHTFLRALDLVPLEPETRERLLSPLESSIAQALRRRAQPPGSELPGDELPENELPGDALPDDTFPGDALPEDSPEPGQAPAPDTFLAASTPANDTVASNAMPGTSLRIRETVP